MDPLRHLGSAQKFALARHLRRTAPPAERYAWSLLRNRLSLVASDHLPLVADIRI